MIQPPDDYHANRIHPKRNPWLTAGRVLDMVEIMLIAVIIVCVFVMLYRAYLHLTSN